MHPKYEVHEFFSQFQLRARFENQENHIKGEFGDILGPPKIPEFTLIMISDLKKANSFQYQKLKIHGIHPNHS